MRAVTHRVLLACVCALLAAACASGQQQGAFAELAAPGQSRSDPIAIVPITPGTPGDAATVTGALEVTAGKAIITSSGSVTSGSNTTDVVLPHRGVLRVCSGSSVKLAADSSVPAGDVPGLLMALDRGAVEASFATGRNADVLLTPDFRILIAGPGPADVKVRLADHGDTCLDNAGVNAPYVVVTSVFGDGLYRVQPGQRVMFQHGSLNEVVDQEKESCGCPAAPKPGSNEFPLAQSEGLAPLAKPVPTPAAGLKTPVPAGQALVYKSADHAPKSVDIPQPAPQPPVAVAANPAPRPKARKKTQGLFGRIGNFFRRIFGAE